MAKIFTYDPGTLIWIDESGHDNRKSMRKYGYSMRGVRSIERKLLELSEELDIQLYLS